MLLKTMKLEEKKGVSIKRGEDNEIHGLSPGDFNAVRLRSIRETSNKD